MIKPTKITLRYTPALFGSNATDRSLIALAKAIKTLEAKVNELVVENNRKDEIIQHLSNK